jgi:RNA polymerase sigma-70 factor (ECF subfamily)
VDLDRMAYEKEALAMLDSTYRLALWLTPREADARDLVQETYLRALEARDTFRPGASMRAWLARILRNRFIDRFRRTGREVPWPDGVEEPKALDAASDGQVGLFGDAELGRLLSLVRGDIVRALQTLPEDHRTVVLLCDVEQWGWEEAASVLEVPVGTVKSRLFRARRALRQLLSEYAPKEASVDPVR